MRSVGISQGSVQDRSAEFMRSLIALKVMSGLALLQAMGGLLRAFNWIQVGVNLFDEGFLLLPFVGTVAIIRGLFISLVALLYFSFAGGSLLKKDWARWVGFAAAILNMLLVLSALVQGSPLREVVVWSFIPILLIVYLFSRAGRVV